MTFLIDLILIKMISRKTLITGLALSYTLVSYSQQKEKLQLTLNGIWSGYFDEQRNKPIF